MRKQEKVSLPGYERSRRSFIEIERLNFELSQMVGQFKLLDKENSRLRGVVRLLESKPAPLTISKTNWPDFIFGFLLASALFGCATFLAVAW